MIHLKTNNIRLHRALLPLLIAAALAGCAAQRLNKDGQRQVQEGRYEQGLVSLRQASLLEPDNLRYRRDYLDRLDDETKNLNQRGEALRLAGDFTGAHYAFLTALNLDQSNERSRRGIVDVARDVRHSDILADADKLTAAGKLDAAKDRIRVVLLSDPANKRANEAMRKIDDQLDAQHRAKEAVIVSQSILKKPVTLQFRDANLRMVFEALSRTTGLNVIFDRDVRADLKTTIFVRDGSIEDTVDLILLQNQLEKRILNANTMFIYPAIATKQKEYQELKVRTFQISNGDAKYIQGMLKSVLKIKEVQVDEHTNTLVLRDTPEALSVAARVIAAHDLPDAEVMLEVEVLEISRDRLSNLGIVWPDNFNVSTPTDVNGGALTLGALKRLSSNSLLTTPLQAGLNLKLQDTDANLLASPRIRVREHEKAKILIGDKVPIITNTVTPVSTGTPVITGSVQYIDVGIKLEAEPHVYAEGDVGIKLNLEVSNIVKEISGPGGSLAYQIGTRMVSTSLRLHDGETQILGGLISDSDRNTAAKVPGIGQLPILGRLFSNNNGNHTKTEIVLSITPRILRAKGIAEDTMADVWSGTEGTIRENPLRLDPISSVSASPNSPAANSAARIEPMPLTLPAKPIETVSNAVPAGSEIVVAVPVPPAPKEPAILTPTIIPTSALPPESAIVQPALPGGTEVAAKTSMTKIDGDNNPDAASTSVGIPVSVAAIIPAATGASPKIILSSPDNVKAGERFNVTLSGENFDNIHALPLSIQYDAVVLTLVEVTLGEFSIRSHVGNVAPSINQPAGRASMLLTADQAASFMGSGELLNLGFVAKLSRKRTQVLVAKVDVNDGHTLLTIPRPQPLTLAVNP
ncbi:cohesin domain-containing protein [Glaciimonas sp. CA11.2]|uniref:secretin N-terminal domain-containing protein n=1 Tax=Glaciimonas sp. CA11.2 TaxID=3048601 RepID=UPI002AB5416A|nr:secretin N-terminal domain-containing protein [Glaciimonas sp. CA11.2]MDY7545097.1 cohesin domain-containing protein [Glaciimonas sp. CA11.2]MEB0162412.1 cohesin domain-containing protein [Glaciimonas sp. CA11.2]